ncbi:hypothetical protein QQF64_007674 [Cirrhinus molitorella]|uniref:Uncharacterized protein n=1 Tax=Cirrhinus molitorella TaxID=172907 RepID=A0ABR3MEK6_9TELE
MGRSAEVISGQSSPWQPWPLPVSDPAAKEPNLRGDVFSHHVDRNVTQTIVDLSCFCAEERGLCNNKRKLGSMQASGRHFLF